MSSCSAIRATSDTIPLALLFCPVPRLVGCEDIDEVTAWPKARISKLQGSNKSSADPARLAASFFERLPEWSDGTAPTLGLSADSTWVPAHLSLEIIELPSLISGFLVDVVYHRPELGSDFIVRLRESSTNTLNTQADSLHSPRAPA